MTTFPISSNVLDYVVEVHMGLFGAFPRNGSSLFDLSVRCLVLRIVTPSFGKVFGGLKHITEQMLRGFLFFVFFFP